MALQRHQQIVGLVEDDAFEAVHQAEGIGLEVDERPDTQLVDAGLGELELDERITGRCAAHIQHVGRGQVGRVGDAEPVAGQRHRIAVLEQLQRQARGEIDEPDDRHGHSERDGFDEEFEEREERGAP